MLSFWRFSTHLGCLILFVFGIHMCYTTYIELLLSYGFNYLITIISFFWFLLKSRRKSETLGFVFMGISGLKFFLFFLLYKPLSIPLSDKKELLSSFFIPYSLCLIYEVYYLVKLLNQKNIEK